MKKILWVSKNKPLPSQIKELHRLFGDDAVIDQEKKPFADAKEIIRKFRRGGYDEMVLIAPLTVCRIITEFGVKPLWSDMKCVTPAESEVEVMGSAERVRGIPRYYKFMKFKRLESVELTFTEI